MASGFSIYPCRCGRIHMISWDLVEEACEKNMDIIHICQRCGKMLRIGGDSFYDEYEKADLDERLQLIQEHLGEQPEIKITFFKPDERKAGGAYLSITGVIKKIDSFERYVVMMDGKKIPIDEIFRIDGELFRLLENESI